jgi:hypothetical protein
LRSTESGAGSNRDEKAEAVDDSISGLAVRL